MGKLIKGVNDLETWCKQNNREDLLREWDEEKNEDGPSDVSAHSSKRRWWRCAQGHEWPSVVGSRTSQRPSGCPFCSVPPKRILIGFNDLESWCVKNERENLLKEWDDEKNGTISPTNISFSSGKRVWWKCNKGHEWCTSVSNRVNGTGCPICSRTQTSFPEQAIAYYLSRLFNIRQRYRRKGYEIDVFLLDYNIGIEYDGMFFHQKEKNLHERDKDAFFQKQGIEIIRIKENAQKCGIEGTTVFYVTGKNKYLNEQFNEVLHMLLRLLEQKTGKRIVDDVDVVRDELVIRQRYASAIKSNSLASMSQALAGEWDVEKNGGMTSESFSANAHVKVWWKCNKGHSWQAVISSRFRGLGCPYCAGQRTIAGENDLQSWCDKNMPGLLLEWDFDKNTIAPSEISKTSNKIAWWKCKNGHEWQAVIANRTHGTRCPYCFTGNAGTKRAMSLLDWCEQNGMTNLILEWDCEMNAPLTPRDVSKGSHKNVWWKCSNGHKWKAQIKSRTYNHGCPFCSKTYKRVIRGKNDLVTWCEKNSKQYIVDEWDIEANAELKPEMFTFGSHRRINWKCRNGHKWGAVIKERTKPHGNMCPYCASPDKEGKSNG